MAKEVKLPAKTPIPSNWVWVEMGLFTKIKSGYPFNSKKFSSNQHNKLPLIRICDVVRGYTTTYTDEICPDDYIILKGDVLIGMDGDFNVEKWQSDKGLLNQRVCKIQTDSNAVESDLLYYYLPIPLKQINEATPSVTVKHLSTKTLEKTPIPLPPRAEQQRIVAVIELLFEKLDRAKELAQSALDSFETRKAAILHKAFTGELTAKWREENGVEMERWEEKTLSEVCHSIFDGDHMPPPKSETGVPFLVISNVNKGYLTFENTRFVPIAYYEKISETRKPRKGDVLYTIVGSFGIPVLVDVEQQFCFQRHMALLKPKRIHSKCLWYLLQTNEIFLQASKIATGTAQLTVPIKGLRDIALCCPTIPEQQEIVRILDNLLDNEQKAKDLCDVIEKIDLMKKAILARAFRGELGTNDPSEKSALGLLKDVLAEK